MVGGHLAVRIQRRTAQSESSLTFKIDPISSVFLHYDGKDARSDIWRENRPSFWSILLSLQSRNRNFSFFYGLWRFTLTVCLAAFCSSFLFPLLNLSFLLLISYISSGFFSLTTRKLSLQSFLESILFHHQLFAVSSSIFSFFG